MPWDGIALVTDVNSFLFSLTHKQKFLPIDPDFAVYMNDNDGPNFGLGALSVADGAELNGHKQSNCLTQTEGYRIGIDEQGRSYLTGEKDKFTCVAIETFYI